MTEQTPTGQLPLKKSKVDISWDAIKDTVDRYMTGMGLMSQPNAEIESIINMSKEERERLAPQQCFDNATALYQMAFHVQKEVNRHTMCVNWVKRNIDALGCNRFQQYGSRYTPHDVRRDMFIKEHEVAFKLHELANVAQNRLDALSYLPTQMRFLANSLGDLGKAKQSQ